MPLVYAITIDPNNSQVVFVDASSSFGSTEQPLFRPIPYQKSGGNAYITMNGGQEWLAYPPPFFRTTIYADGGTVADDFPPFGPVTRSKVWYRTSGAFDSVQKSDDGALTFEVINKGINGVFVNNIWLHPSPPAPYTSMLLVAVEEQLLFLTDTVDTWPRQRPAHGEQYTWSFDADYYNPDAVYYSIGYPAWNLIGQIGVHRLTFDCFGHGCEPGEVLLGDTGVWRVFTTPLEPKLIYAACQDKGIMISYNRGRKWYEFNLGLTMPKSISDIVFDEGGLPFLAAARTSNGDLGADPPHHWNPTPDEKGGVYRINLETAKWELLPDITSATLDLEFDPRNRQILYAATALGVYKTTDGGEKWERVSLPLSIFDLLVDPLNPDNVYAATANAGVWLSTDSGGHWENISQGLLEKMVLSLALDPETGILYAGTGGNSVYQLVPDGNP